MIEKRNLKKTSTNDVIKIISYMFLMTALFILYCTNGNKNDQIEKSLDDYIHAHSYDNEIIKPSTENGNGYLFITCI